MAWTTVEGWRAGRVWKGKNGALHFYVRRKGKDLPTGATTLPGALAALERLEQTGEAIAPEPREPVYLDATLADEFLEASRAKGNSYGWRLNQNQHLLWWRENIGRLDLRTGHRGSITRENIRAALAGAPSARQREAVLRALYTYLRGKDRVTTAEDPTWGCPRIAPAGRPAQDKTDKAIAPEAVETIRRYLEAEYLRRGRTGRRWADLISVLDGTGMHVSELARFARGGAIELLPAGRAKTPAESGVLMVPMHKSGAPWRVAVSAATLDAARRVLEAGPFSISVFYAELRKAAKDAKCGAKVLPGRFRHTTAKHAVEAGATIQEVATFLGHKSPATTKKFYATLGVPQKIPTRR